MKIRHAAWMVLLPLLAPGAWAAPPARPPAAGAPAAAGGAQVDIRFVVDPLMMCHYYFKDYGPASIKPRSNSGVDLTSEANAYVQAAKLIEDPEAWTWLEERIVSKPDVPSLRKALADPPAQFRDEDTRTAFSMVADALEQGCPGYQKTVFPTESIGVNRLTISARKRLRPSQDRVTSTLMKSMDFKPIDAPISIYVVTRTGGQATWGKGDRSYYTVIGAYGQSPSSLLETGIHEATHVLDAMQPYETSSVLQAVRKGVKPDQKKEAETFLHGLITYNAGELVKRFVNHSYSPKGVLSPDHADEYRPYLSTYEYIWVDYLDGKMTRDQISKKLIEEFEAVRKLQADQQKKKAS